MTKHQIVHDLVEKLTSRPSFKTFFTLYLMAETKKQRNKIEDRFWKEVNKLPKSQQQLINAEFIRTFLQLPSLTEQLRKKSTGIMALSVSVL